MLDNIRRFFRRNRPSARRALISLVSVLAVVASAVLIAGGAPPTVFAETPVVDRVLGVLAEDTSSLPPGLTESLDTFRTAGMERFSLRGSLLSRSDLLTTGITDLLVSREWFLASKHDSERRQLLRDFLSPGHILLALHTTPREVLQVLRLTANTTGWPDGYSAQLSAIAPRPDGQWSVGVVLEPAGKVRNDVDDLTKSILSSIDAWQAAPEAPQDDNCSFYYDYGWLQLKSCPWYNYQEYRTMCETSYQDAPGATIYSYRQWHFKQSSIGPTSADGCTNGWYANALTSKAILPGGVGSYIDWGPMNSTPVNGYYEVGLSFPNGVNFTWGFPAHDVSLRDRSNGASGIVSLEFKYPGIPLLWPIVPLPASLTHTYISEPGWIERTDARTCPTWDRVIDYTTGTLWPFINVLQWRYQLTSSGRRC